MPACAGGRFFWVGHHARPSDSTESCHTTASVGTALATQDSVHKLSRHPADASRLHNQHSLSQAQSGGFHAHSFSILEEEQSWSTPLQLQSDISLARHACKADAPSSWTQNTQHASFQCATDAANTPLAAGLDSSMLSPSAALATDCPPEDLDQLLNWAADPALQSLLPEPATDATDLSMPHELADSYILQHEPMGSSIFCRQLSCSWETQASDLDATDCLPDLSEQAESYADDLAYAQLPALDVFAEAAMPQQLTTSSELMGAVSGQLSSDLSDDPLDHLLQAGCSSSHGTMHSHPSPVSVSAAQQCSSSIYADSNQDSQTPTKKRCGRPRVYDLDRPLATGTQHAAPHCMLLDANCISLMCSRVKHQQSQQQLVPWLVIFTTSYMPVCTFCLLQKQPCGNCFESCETADIIVQSVYCRGKLPAWH